MSQITADQLMQKATQIQKLMAVAAQESDPERAKALSEQLAAEGRALEELGEKYRQQETKRRGSAGRLEVVLTADQRKRILQKTGIAMETVVIEDEAGALNQTMPQQRPEHIEKLATEEAERRKTAAEAEKVVRARLDEAMADIEAQGNAELSEQLQRLKDDPNFAGGLLKKK